MSKWLELTKEQRLWTIRFDNSHYANTPEEIQCPWCSTKQQLDFEDVSYEDDDITTYECSYSDCGKKFDVHTSVSYDWHTELPEDYLVERAKKEVPDESK